ncbi:MAG: DEAD/DEAH box helicase [Gordonia sp. (in: high G+C Gram-positive bacteria)]
MTQHPNPDGLRPFQEATVAHVLDRFFGTAHGSRFLVADETGLGKTLVARGVVSGVIARMTADPSVHHVDVVYICSNQDVARQNISRLTGPDVAVHELPTRLTLLSLQSASLTGQPTHSSGGKPVRVIALTPGTSFDPGHRTGQASERLLILMILEKQLAPTPQKLTGTRLRGAREVLRATSGLKSFLNQSVKFRTDNRGRISPAVETRFMELMRQPNDDGTTDLERFIDISEQIGGLLKWRRKVPPGLKEEANGLVGRTRGHLAQIGTEILHPNLVILDEFQRFTEILDERTPIGQTALPLFDYGESRVLLLSATPFAPFTEKSGNGSNAHHTEFLRTITFLADGSNGIETSAIETLLAAVRSGLVNGDGSGAPQEALRKALLMVMCRTERPTTVIDSMTEPPTSIRSQTEPSELVSWLQLSRLAQQVDAPLRVDLWKSVPHLPHFIHDYLVGKKAAKLADTDPAVRDALSNLATIDPAEVKRFGAISPGNGRLRSLFTQIFDHEQMWGLLWCPPTLPYLRPGGPFTDVPTGTSKRLLFSSWIAAPRSIATLTSYEVNRRIVEASGRGVQYDATQLSNLARLDYRVSGGLAMSTLLLFLPLPSLAAVADPLDAARGGTVDPEVLLATIGTTLGVPGEQGQLGREPLDWARCLAYPDPVLRAVVDGGRLATWVDPAEGRLPAPYDAVVREALTGGSTGGTRTPGAGMATVALHSPANCAWRALGRLPGVDRASDTARWHAAARIAEALRLLFNRWDAALLLDGLYGRGHYWAHVLRYCADGNLQAVLDEYLYQMFVEGGRPTLDDDSMADLAARAAAAIGLRPADYSIPAPDGADPIRFPGCRFAMHHGSYGQDQSARPSEIRDAFNSPFGPFLLASTSTGQEGIDFHPWCRTLVHWNIPSNPVDFEQREGRVNRFRGHAIRLNVVDRHGTEMLRSETPWACGFDAAAAQPTEDDCDVPGLAPDWALPGPYKVRREVYPYDVSSDADRLTRTRRRVGRYRLAFGQPRQEDLIEVLESLDLSEEEAAKYRVDLRPPSPR